MFEFPGFDEKIISNMEIRMLLEDDKTDNSLTKESLQTNNKYWSSHFGPWTYLHLKCSEDILFQAIKVTLWCVRFAVDMFPVRSVTRVRGSPR